MKHRRRLYEFIVRQLKHCLRMENASFRKQSVASQPLRLQLLQEEAQLTVEFQLKGKKKHEDAYTVT